MKLIKDILATILPPGFRIVMLLLPTLGGVLVISSLIGVLSNVIQNKIEDLRKGRSLVMEENHTVILGWSSQIFTVLAEIIEANINPKNPAIAILADREKIDMEDETPLSVVMLSHVVEHVVVRGHSEDALEPVSEQRGSIVNQPMKMDGIASSTRGTQTTAGVSCR